MILFYNFIKFFLFKKKAIAKKKKFHIFNKQLNKKKKMQQPETLIQERQSLEPIQEKIQEENKIIRTYFKPNKKMGDPFFKNTKVGSCSHVLVTNGKTLAISFAVKNRRGRGLNHFKTVPGKLSVSKSTYMNDYHLFPNLHAGMGKKPLMTYSPDSFRSRLPLNGIVSGAANNRSYLDLGDKGIINRNQWGSTNRLSYQWPRIVPISNSGICADMAKAAHMRMNSVS